VQIRQARADDVAAIAELVEAAYFPYLERIGRAPAPVGADYPRLVAAGDVWIGSSGGRVVGVLVIRPVGETLELENVAVEPAHQRHGCGRELIAFAERHAQELGLESVSLYTNEAMVENLRLYPRLGFVETGRRVEDGHRRVYFRKTLDAGPLRR
jgi:ribosomal protein S18 acetylase RimI-like enzyme